MTLEELADELGISLELAKLVLNRLIEKGLVQECPPRSM
ncbi:winged helix-turn-helix transcriptional regulator [Pantanalinema sp. GBBB05]|nr:winged helix-turn-helix transcriptional regulator [Pantanalinema sp. GBBB05]